MSLGSVIVATGTGIIFMVAGFKNKSFYWVKNGFGARQGRPVPRWAGKLLFIEIGSVLLIVAGYNLLIRLMGHM